MAQRRKKREEEEQHGRIQHEEQLRQQEEEKRNRRKSQFSALKVCSMVLDMVHANAFLMKSLYRRPSRKLNPRQLVYRLLLRRNVIVHHP